MEEILCVPIFIIKDKQVVYIPMMEFYSNPRIGHYLVNDNRYRPGDPIRWEDPDGTKFYKKETK